MKRFILHVGLHKTATSSIQQTLAINASELKTQGFYYPTFGEEDAGIINHSIPYYSAYCKHPEKYHINIRNGFSSRINEVNAIYLKQIKDVLASDTNVIISGEDISILDVAALNKIKNEIISNGFNLDVYCAIRRPYSFTCSELQERIKSGVSTLRDIQVQLKASVIEKLQHVFGESIEFFSFEKDCESMGPILSFLKRIGVNYEKMQIINSNEGFGNISTRILSHLNSKYPVIVDGILNKDKRKQFTTSFDTHQFLLTQSEFNLIKSDIDAENNYYKEILGDEFLDEKINFSSEVKLSIDDAVKIYDLYAEKHTSKWLLEYIHTHADFNFVLLNEMYLNNTDVLRDIALVLENTNLYQALEIMEKARELRPDGPLINEKIQYYKKKLVNLNTQKN